MMQNSQKALVLESLFLIKLQDEGLFSWKFCETFKDSFLTEYLLVTASE